MSTEPLRISERLDSNTESLIDLSAIIGGALLATALAFLLTTFGSAVGLSMLSPYRGEGSSGTGFIVAIGLWMIWVVVSSMMAGGYVAGRMRQRVADIADHEVEIRDGFNGLVVWALATIFGAWLTVNVTIGAARTSGEVVEAGASAAAGAAASVLGAAIDDVDPISVATDRLLRSSQPASDDSIARLLATAASADPDVTDPDGDRQYLVNAVASRIGLTPEEAATRVDAAYAKARELADDAREAADTARKIGVLLAFVTAASLLAGAVGAWWAANRGGRHRDQRTDFSRLTHWED